MDRCPACNARYTGKPACHRCGADLARLTAIETEARQALDRALAARGREDYPAMYRHARRSCDLRRTPESTAALAAAALLTRRFRTALAQWRRSADLEKGEKRTV